MAERPEVLLDGFAEAIIGAYGPEQQKIAIRGLGVVRMLLDKNRKYGSSATQPIRVFSKAEPLEGIKLRMDDKLSRIRAGAADDDEDPILDLAGYCILHLVAQDDWMIANNPEGYHD